MPKQQVKIWRKNCSNAWGFEVDGRLYAFFTCLTLAHINYAGGALSGYNSMPVDLAMSRGYVFSGEMGVLEIN